jgi:hypothetical protein
MAEKLTPPDLLRCQCDVGALAHSPFTLGPMMSHLCGEPPVWLAVEVLPGKDGLCGSMSLCQKHADVLLSSAVFRNRVNLQPILSGPDGPRAGRALRTL